MQPIGQAGQPCTNLDNIDQVDMTSVSYLRNGLRAPHGPTVTRADGQS
jgi:hypothetical protein